MEVRGSGCVTARGARTAPLIVAALLSFRGSAPLATALWNDCAFDRVVDVGAAGSRLAGFWDFWNSHVRNYSHLHIDSGTSLDEGRFFMRWARILTGSDEMLAETVGSCLFGVLTVLLQALPAVDYERGRTEALGMLDRARSIFFDVAQLGEFSEVMREAHSLGWEVQSIFRALRAYDSVFSEPSAVDPTSCAGPKFFVYPAPRAVPKKRSGSEIDRPDARSSSSVGMLLRAGSQNYLDALMRRPLQCLFGMYGTELLLHNFFLRSPCSVSDPEEADLFYVPSYFKCIEVMNYVDHFNENGDEAHILFEQTIANVVQAGPWFRKHDGADHVFLFSWGRFPCRLPNWRLALRSAIALQVENQCEDLNAEEPQPTFSRWKDVIIPGHIDHWRVYELRKWNRPTPQRDILVAFHGRHAANADTYANVTVRTRILEELGGLPGVSVGGFIEGYHELLGRSIFCLAPRGITPWTIHLYVAILAGCIPIILSDDIELPFQEFVSWPTFSVKWPMGQVDRSLYMYLSSMPTDVVKGMKRQVDAHACWFDYYSTQDDCSPYIAAMKLLGRRLLHQPRYVGQWWGPEHQHRLELHSNNPEVALDGAPVRKWPLLWHGLPGASSAAEEVRSHPLLKSWRSWRRELKALGAEIHYSNGVATQAGSQTGESGPVAPLDRALAFFEEEGRDDNDAVAVMSENAAEVLIPHLVRLGQQVGQCSGWRIFVWVQDQRSTPYFRAWAWDVNQRWDHERPVVALVTDDFQHVLSSLSPSATV